MFGVNVALSAQASQGIEALSELNSKMAELMLTVENISNNISAAQSSIEAAKNGEEVDVEQHFNDALVSSMILDDKLTFAQEWAAGVHEYLKGKNISDNSLLAFSCDQWVRYGCLTPGFNNNLKRLTDFLDLGVLLPDSELKKLLFENNAKLKLENNAALKSMFDPTAILENNGLLLGLIKDNEQLKKLSLMPPPYVEVLAGFKNNGVIQHIENSNLSQLGARGGSSGPKPHLPPRR